MHIDFLLSGMNNLQESFAETQYVNMSNTFIGKL